MPSISQKLPIFSIPVAEFENKFLYSKLIAYVNCQTTYYTSYNKSIYLCECLCVSPSPSICLCIYVYVFMFLCIYYRMYVKGSESKTSSGVFIIEAGSKTKRICIDKWITCRRSCRLLHDQHRVKLQVKS